ncbi:MAG: hypothetical protein ABW022_17800 [Actinoplanes sp.]
MVGEDNLSAILVNVAADARPATRVKIANSAETRAFLDIGLLLLRDDLLNHRGPDLLDDHDHGTCLFVGLSQARLIERAEHEDVQADKPKVLTVGMFRDRWRYKSRYTEDLISYLFRPALLEQYMADMRIAATKIAGDTPSPDLIRRLVDAVMATTLNDPLWSLQTILWVALPNHPRIQAFLISRYEQWISHWSAVYQELADSYQLELRPQYTWRDVAELFNAVADGARVRARVMGSIASLSTGDNVVVGAIHAMMPQLFVDPHGLGGAAR